ncbi:hypothetical protein DFH07DRAFT_762787 [Mycena maculata]|uniref:Uncharacterized protein n=1 Tax=Mycena maculata TaxID=230809 RepID=A0AAD7MFK7_9AGAR|nr:hypothetical protein DFH07DRAFT_762787 [Mycena maculata]
MGNRRISPGLKERALELWNLGWDAEDICFIFHVSPRSLYQWHDIFDKFGSVTKPPSPLHGCDCPVGLAALTSVTEVYFQDSTIMFTELMWHLAINHDITISQSALGATLQRVGKVLQKTASERNEEAREDYCTLIKDPEHFSGTGMEFVTVDESSKDEREISRAYGRAPVGQRAVHSTPWVRDEHYTLTAVMSTQGYIATPIIVGAMDAHKFLVSIVEDVVRGPTEH